MGHSVLDGLGQVDSPDAVAAIEVGDGSGDAVPDSGTDLALLDVGVDPGSGDSASLDTGPADLSADPPTDPGLSHPRDLPRLRAY